MEHAPRDPDDTAVLADLDPKLHGLPLRIRADVPLFTGVLYSAAPNVRTRGRGSLLYTGGVCVGGSGDRGTG